MQSPAFRHEVSLNYIWMYKGCTFFNLNRNALLFRGWDGVISAVSSVPNKLPAQFNWSLRICNTLPIVHTLRSFSTNVLLFCAMAAGVTSVDNRLLKSPSNNSGGQSFTCHFAFFIRFRLFVLEDQYFIWRLFLFHKFYNEST